MNKVLVVYNHLSAWIKDDINILKKRYDVDTFYYKKDRRNKNLSHLIKYNDIIFIWFASYHGLKPSFLAKKYGKKVITVASGYSVANLPEYGYGLASKFYTRWIPRFILKRSDVVLAVSQSNKKEIKELYPHPNIIVVPHGFNLDYFKPYGKKEKIVITVGSIDRVSIKRKGIDKFVEIAKYFGDVPFVVIGKINVNLKKVFREIPGNVKFTGFVPDDELLRWYQKAKVYAQFSFHEAFGCSVAEAMLCGCIPVVTNKYALPEVVDNYGFIVPYWDEEKAIDAIKRALNTPIELGMNARRRIVENFSMEDREKKLIGIIEELK